MIDRRKPLGLGCSRLLEQGEHLHSPRTVLQQRERHPAVQVQLDRADPALHPHGCTVLGPSAVHILRHGPWLHALHCSSTGAGCAALRLHLPNHSRVRPRKLARIILRGAARRMPVPQWSLVRQYRADGRWAYLRRMIEAMAHPPCVASALAQRVRSAPSFRSV